MLIPKFLEKNNGTTKQEWIADAMIDSLDLDRLGIEKVLKVC